MEHLAKNPVLVLFLLIGVGMLVGHIKIKGISLGAAAVLFAGIALGAYADFLGVDLKLPQLLGTLGLAIFTFSIGVSSGPGFFQVIKTAAGPLLAMLGVFIVSAGAAQALGRAFGMNSALIAGTWAGAITNTPALAAAGSAAQNAGDPDGTATATVGYAVAYLFGVIGMLFFASPYATAPRTLMLPPPLLTPPSALSATITSPWPRFLKISTPAVTCASPVWLAVKTSLLKPPT